ncbi:hypothetical protein Hanom_Chr17g01566121 [Helianthus anomalus]
MPYVQGLMQNYYRVGGVSLEAASLFLRGRGKAVCILPSSDPTLALLLVGFTEYDDDDDDDDDDGLCMETNAALCLG